MMKRIFAVLALLLLPALAAAQRIEMEEERLAFDYPESWLVVSPQLAEVYAPLLEQAGLPDTLPEELSEQRVASRAYSEDFSQWLSVLTASDDMSAEIYEIDRASDAQRKTLKNRVLANALWETTGCRAQDAEWQRIGGEFWLYVYYTRMYGDALVGRGLRYLTIRNGMYVQLDYQTGTRRLTNRDIASFKARVPALSVTGSIPEPMRTVKLEAVIPAETSTAEFSIAGTTSPGAALVLEAPDGAGQLQTLSVGEAGASGAFSLIVLLEEEGTYPVTLTASREGMLASSLSGDICYSAKTLPVTLGLPEDGFVSSDAFTLAGTTLPGVQLQLVTPFGLSKKKSGAEGTFSFDLTLKEAGDYAYTLIGDRKGFDQRRISFTLTRVMTEAEARKSELADAEKIAYKTLQKDLDDNRGKKLYIRGPVVSVDQGESTTFIRMLYSRDAKGEWFNPVYVVAEGETQVREGDMLTAAVTVAGVFEEQDAKGEPVMIPKLKLNFVDKLE